MRVMVMVKATPSSEAGEMPGKQLFEDMGRFNEELVKAGIMKAGEGLRPTSQGVRVHFSGTDRSVTDGPFAETKEQVAGFWLWEVSSMQEAIDWVKRCPNPMLEESDIDIRPLYETEDFAEIDPTGELRAHEARLHETIALQQSTVQPYLFFGGRCEEALEFYQQALGATVKMVLRYSDSPEPVPKGLLAPGFESKIMHAEFGLGRMSIMCSDGCGPELGDHFKGFRLTLTVPTPADVERAFNALSQGGKADMPPAKTFWSASYGQVTDKFGVGWMVMAPGDSK